MTINSRPSRPRTFLTGYAESTRDHDAGAKAGWTDPVDVATRRAAWARRRSERRSRHALSQKAGLAGAALMLLVMLFSFPPSTNPFERVQTPAVAEVQETPATASVDATDIGS